MICVMDAWCEGRLSIDPAAPLDVATKKLPARWAVYLMRDATGQPVQLLSVRNVRASVRRRLGDATKAGPSRKIDYRSVVREICWKRVDSAFESDLVYLDVARTVFPETYRKIMPLRRPAFVHVNPEAPFPRWTRVNDPAIQTGMLFGPLAEQAHANKLIETIEDLFDLCRYYTVLTATPHGSPCAYKDMGKCPAPCDGSVSMQQYKQMIGWSVSTLANPLTEIEDQTDRMRQAAGELRFETAGRIKQFIDGLKTLNQGHWRHARPLTDFRFLALEPGPAKGKVKLYAIRPTSLSPVVCLTGEPRELMSRCPEIAALTKPGPVGALTEQDVDRISLVARHLFWPRSGGLFLHGNELTDLSILTAYRQLAQRDVAVPADEDDEGVVAELTPGM